MLADQVYQRTQEQGFLPAALEVRDTPPSPMGRAILWTILLFFILTIAWASYGKVDIVAVAPGRIIPSGHSKVIQPLETGTVHRLYVTEGQPVHKGDILVELDPTTSLADLRRLQQEAQELRQQCQRLERILALNQHERSDADYSRIEYDQLTPLQERLFKAQWQEYLLARKTMQEELDKILAEAHTLEQQISKLRATLPLIAERADDMQRLLQTNAVARHRVLEVKQEKLAAEHDLQTLLSQREEFNQREQELRTRISHHQSQLQSQTMQELTASTQRLASIEQEIIKATSRKDAQTLRSPVDGVVQQLAIHTIGGVVSPAQELMTIVPEGETLEVEAMLANKDIGFVAEGQSVEVKIDAFPFTKYGTLQGSLTDISNDAILDDAKGLVFKTQVRLQNSVIPIGKRQVALTPGMSVTVEVKTGTRRVIEFFLAPLLRYQHESIRER